MTLFKKFILIVVISCAFISCEDSASFDIPLFPSIYVEEGNSFELKVGEELDLHIVVESFEPITTLEFYKNGRFFQEIKIEPTQNVRHEYKFHALKEDVGDSQTLTFVAITEEGSTSFTTIVVTVVETPLLFMYSNAFIFNKNSANPFSWDLVNNKSGRLDNKIDIVNTSNPLDGWISGWEAKNTTTFAKVTYPITTPIDELTMEDLESIYNSETPSSILVLETGDCLVAKLRGTDEYAIIGISLVDHSAESISFTYWKSTELAGK